LYIASYVVRRDELSAKKIEQTNLYIVIAV
jgi:hypothetical protein